MPDSSLDLFGDPIAELPVRRPKSSLRLGAPKPTAQPIVSKQGLPVATSIASMDDETELRRTLADLSVHGVVKQYLKDRNLPYVDVFEVKEEYFVNADLELFDFVVSAPEGHNWLLYTAPLSTAAHDDLRQWERVFGPGFQALVAEKIDSGDDDTSTLSFRTLEGERVTLE